MLRAAIEATFAASATHPLPVSLPAPPSNWANAFRRLALEVGLEHTRLAEAHEAARQFVDPVLHGEANGFWDPEPWSWQPMKRDVA